MAKSSKNLAITIPVLLAQKQLNGNIEKCISVFGPGSTSLTLLSETAFQCLLHASKHGDVTKCERLYMGLGGVAKGRAAAAVRVEALKSWFAKHGPVTARNGKWQIKEGKDWRDASLWTLEDALKSPFWEDMGAEARPMGFDNLWNLLKGLPKRVDKAVEEGTFKGDPVKVKEWANNVVSFAEKQAASLSPEAKGETDLTQEVIREAASTSTEKKARSKTAAINKEPEAVAA